MTCRVCQLFVLVKKIYPPCQVIFINQKWVAVNTDCYPPLYHLLDNCEQDQPFTRKKILASAHMNCYRLFVTNEKTEYEVLQ